MDGESRDWDGSEVEEDEEEEEGEEDSYLPLKLPSSPSTPSSRCFERNRHVMYLEMMYELLPHHYQSQEINRLTLAHFVISGLSLLGALDLVDKDAVANWVLSFRAHPRNRAALSDGLFYGFHGSRTSQFLPDDDGVLTQNGSHLASTYCALAILKNIGYDFTTVDSESILLSMRHLQQHDGSFMPIHIGAETDLRFVYCAAAICFMLGDWSGMDREKAKEYILNCQSYDGGFGLTPGSESHVSQRQAGDGGFQGRPNKPSDTCYAFWIGAVLKILGGYKFIDMNALHQFLLTCQSQYGGFSKFPGELPDLYHSYYGYTAFSLLEEPGLNPLCPELGITDVTALGI